MNHVFLGIQIFKKIWVIGVMSEIYLDNMVFEKIKNKILKEEDFEKFRRINQNKKIVFCSGCYDILHSGHVAFFENCRQKGDILVVGVGRDSIIKRLKGKDRPINPEKNRLFLLASIQNVDFVCLNQEKLEKNEIDFRKTFELLKPDVYCLNNDNKSININKNFAKEMNVKFILMKRNLPKFLEKTSTSKILKKIKKN